MEWTTLDKIYADTRLSATDKAVYTLIAVRMDNTHEYRLGLNYLTRTLQIQWQTARQAVGRLVGAGYLAPINPGTRHVTWRLLRPWDAESLMVSSEPTAKRKIPSAGLAPQDAPRMAMPADLASDLLRYAMEHRRLIDTAIISEMGSITRDDRLRWQSESDHVGDVMETLTRWMTRFGGGVPPEVQSESDIS